MYIMEVFIFSPAGFKNERKIKWITRLTVNVLFIRLLWMFNQFKT